MNHLSRAGEALYRPLGLAALLALAGALAGCASINSFRVSPRSVCRGDTVVASWSATGRVSLRSTPVLPGTGAQASSDEKSFIVHKPTHFVLTARRLFDQKAAEADVAVEPRQLAFGSVAQCDAKTRVISAMLVLDRQLSGAFEVDAVRNPLDRTLHISKDGRTAELGAHQQSSKFAGQPVRGTWRLTSPLAPAESCRTAMRGIRQRLQIQLTLKCGG